MARPWTRQCVPSLRPLTTAEPESQAIKEDNVISVKDRTQEECQRKFFPGSQHWHFSILKSRDCKMIRGLQSLLATCSYQLWFTSAIAPFYRVMICQCGISCGPVSLSVCVSVTSGIFVKTAELVITETVLHYQFSGAKGLGEIPVWFIPNEGFKCSQGRKICEFRQISRYLLKTVQFRQFL